MSILKHIRSRLERRFAAEAAWDAAKVTTAEQCHDVLYRAQLDNGLTGRTINRWVREYLSKKRAA